LYSEWGDRVQFVDVIVRQAHPGKKFHRTAHWRRKKLLAANGLAPAGMGIERVPHLLAALAAGWSAIRPGLLQSYTDLERALPGAALATLAGYLVQLFSRPSRSGRSRCPGNRALLCW